MKHKVPVLGENNQYHFVYRTHNLINGKEYTGKHSCYDLIKIYYGSGLALKSAIAKYGLENFAVEFLSFHDTSDEAFIEEAKIVDEEYIWRDDTYNGMLGGQGGWHHCKGKVVVKDKNGNTMQVSVDDPRYLSGELTYHNGDAITVVNANGKTLSISASDYRFLSGEFQSIHKNKVVVKDKDGNKFQVAKDDPRYLSGELVGVNKGSHPIQQKLTCPHCGKIGGANGMTRWHFDKCKLLKNI